MLEPLEGWTVSAEAIEHGGFQIVLGLAVSQRGTYGYPSVLLTYADASGERFTEVFLQGGQVCAPVTGREDRVSEIGRDPSGAAEDR